MNHVHSRRFAVPALTVLAIVLAACGSGRPAASHHRSEQVTTTVVTGGTVGTVRTTTPKPPATRRKPTTKTTTKPAPKTTTTTVPTTNKTGPCTAGFVCGHVTAIGDSVMLDAQPDLQADIPGIDVEAEVSRQWEAGIYLAQAMRADRTLGSIVVIDLGTNGPVDLDQFQQMMSVLAGASVVVFVTIHLPSYYSWSTSVNATLEQGVPMYHNTRLANFNVRSPAQIPNGSGPTGCTCRSVGPEHRQWRA